MNRRDVQERLTQLRLHMPAIRLYALVDGVQYSDHMNAPLAPRPGFASLFENTLDAELAHAGPWLIDAAEVGDAIIDDLAELEQTAPAVVWLFAYQDPGGLAQLLQLNLDMALPDGRSALLRLWDPRVLISLVEILNSDQREQLFGQVHEWYLLHDGRRTWIGRPNA